MSTSESTKPLYLMPIKQAKTTEAIDAKVLKILFLKPLTTQIITAKPINAKLTWN